MGEGRGAGGRCQAAGRPRSRRRTARKYTGAPGDSGRSGPSLRPVLVAPGAVARPDRRLADPARCAALSPRVVAGSPPAHPLRTAAGAATIVAAALGIRDRPDSGVSLALI